jgi:hypothetical protein
MKITISHNQSTIDPSATVTDEAFPSVLADLERQYTKALLKEFPDAEIVFLNGDDTHAIKVSDDDDGHLGFEVQRITEDVFATGTFWPA